MNTIVSINSEVAACEAKSSTIGFLIFENDRRNAQPIGTGTLVRLGTVCGVLTAGHVIKRLPMTGEVGIVTFPSIRPCVQNLTIEMDYTTNVVIWDGIDSNAPDVGFLRVPDRTVAYMEVIGCIFHNLEKTRRSLSGPSETNLASFYAIIGVIAEWATDLPGKRPKTRIKDVQGLFLAVSNIRESFELGSSVFECKIHYSSDARVPTSYGGVSGGALWQFEVERSGRRIVAIKKKLAGVAFRQSAVVNDERLIYCQGRDAIEQLITMVRGKWMQSAA